MEFHADAGVGGVGVRPVGVGAKLDFAALGHDVRDGGFGQFACGGRTALRAGLVALQAFVIVQRGFQGGDLGGSHAGQDVGRNGRHGGAVAFELEQDVRARLFEQAAAVGNLLANAVIFQAAGFGGVVFLAGAFLNVLNLLDKFLFRNFLIAGDHDFAAGALHGLPRELSRGDNGGGQCGDFRGVNSAVGQCGRTICGRGGGNDCFGSGKFVEPALIDVAAFVGMVWLGCGSWGRSGIGHG